MQSWTISQRIIATGLTVLALVCALTFIAEKTLADLHSHTREDLRDDAIPGIVNVGIMTSSSLRSYTRALLAGSTDDPAGRDRLMAESKQICDTQVEAALAKYETTIRAVDDRKNFEELTRKRNAFAAVRARYFELLAVGDRAGSSAFMHAQLEPAFAAYRDHLAGMLEWNQNLAIRVTAESVDDSQAGWRLVMAASIATVVVTVVLGTLVVRNLNRTLRSVSATLDDAANQVASAAGEVASSSQALASGASEQAASLEETSSSLEELSSMTKRNNDGAIAAKQLAGETRGAAETGNSDMAEMRSAMDAIKTSSADIAKIIKTIDEIAFQTNILALNAAVEAARAGEHGAGFAVVAEEVRALAQRSATAAKETAAKIEDSIGKSEHGAGVSLKVAESLGIIVERARKVDILVAEIATASQEQSQGIGQINAAVSQMDKVTQSNAGNAEETAAAAQQLNAQSVTLRTAVGDLRRLVGGVRHAAPAVPPAPVSPRAPASQPEFALRKPVLTGSAVTPDDFFRDPEPLSRKAGKS